MGQNHVLCKQICISIQGHEGTKVSSLATYFCPTEVSYTMLYLEFLYYLDLSLLLANSPLIPDKVNNSLLKIN